MPKNRNPLKGVRTGTAHYIGKSHAVKAYGSNAEAALAEGRIQLGAPVINKATQKLLIEKNTGRYIIEEI